MQTVGLRFCGAADQALARLRGALPTGIIVMFDYTCIPMSDENHLQKFIAEKPTRKALDELSDLYSHLRVWRIERHVYINPLMPPTEGYHRDLFFQVCQLQIYANFPSLPKEP